MPDESGKPTVDDLVTQMREMNERSTAALEAIASRPLAAPVAPSAPESPSKSLSTDEIAAQFKEHVNAGDADKAFKLAAELALQPQMTGMMLPVYEQLGEMNLDRLKREAGARFTPQRAALLDQKRQEYKLSKADLRNYKVVEDLWKITLGSDPSVDADREAEFQKRLAEERARMEAENSKYRNPAPLGPITSLPADLPKDEAEKYLFPDNDEVRRYLDNQLKLGAYGVSYATYIKQRRKDDDPRCVEQVGAGPFAKKTWTLIGDPPDTKKGLI